MTVVNPKSISGINSITMASGSDNLLTIHTTNTTERVRVNSDGDVIVGSGITVSPDGDIFATGVTTSTTFVGALSGNATSATTSTNVTVADESSDTTCFPLFATDATGNVAPKSGSNLTFNSSTGDLGVTKVTASNVTSSGTILVDTTSYSEASTDGDDIIIGSTSDTSKGLSIVGSTSGGINNIFFTDGASYKNQGNIQYRHADDSMRISVNQNERLRIASDGDIGIGTITPQNNARLQVSTSNQVVAAFEGTGGSDPQIYLGDDMTTPTDNCIIMGYDKADNRGYLTVGGDGDNVFTVKNGGDIEIGVGNLKFGTSGKGIDFSAQTATSASGTSVSSEVLDHYEEGDWSPVIVGTVSNPTFTYASGFPRGRYIRTGASVTLWYDIAWSGISGGGGTMYIQGFPFATGGSFYYGGGTMVHANGTTNGLSGAEIGGRRHYANASSTFMFTIKSGSHSSSFQISELNSSGHIFGFFTYKTDA